MLRYAGYAIVYAILLGAVACTIRGERRQARRGDRLDSMIDVVAEREQEPRNLAWPPQIERLPPSAACPECTWWYDGAPVCWPCPAHDPGFISEWEERLSL